MDTFTTEDEKFMLQVLELAVTARGDTSPNPMVGAVVVKKGQVIGYGYHKKAGTPHAEINALDMAGHGAEGATIYLNLEPCSHWGRTPACTERIIREKPARVVIAMQDPNPLVNGRGITKLRDAGISVQTGLLEDKARQLNEFFIKYITTGLPFVTIKTALTMDGKICTSKGDSQWITNTNSRQYVHRQRYYHDAILAGIGTVLKDDPQLNCRITGQETTYPCRIVLDSTLRINPQAKLITGPKPEKVIIVTTQRAPRMKIDALCKRDVQVITMDTPQIQIPDLLKILGQREITSLLVEGGGKVYSSFFKAGLVDKVLLFIGPKILGDHSAPGFVEKGEIALMREAILFKLLRIQQFEDDVLLEYGCP